jgi:3-deoxy-D-manno-octulosonic-acid transferase
VALPYLVYLAFQSKYRQSIPKRFFFPSTPFENNRIWFHAASLGEVSALQPLISALHDHEVAITTVTNTGYNQAKKYKVPFAFLPYEIFLPFWVRKQKVLIVLEAELWFMLFYIATRLGTPTVLLNARISDRSVKRYQKFAFFYRRLFKYVDVVFAQSQKDKERLEILGAKNVHVVGNVKLAQKISMTKMYEKPAEEMIVAGSTHEGEEEGIVDAYLAYNQGKLIVVPRHPERFDKVAKMVEEKARQSGKTFHRFSDQQNFESDMIVVDMLGELINIYAISDIVILGGAFVKVGGHNPVEPLAFNTKIISGHHIFNQQTIFKDIEGALFCELDELADVLKQSDTIEKATMKNEFKIEPVIQKIEELITHEKR